MPLLPLMPPRLRQPRRKKRKLRNPMRTWYVDFDTLGLIYSYVLIQGFGLFD